MGAEDGVKYLIESFKSLGYWFWLILFGAVVVVFAVINRPEFVPLGLYIFIDGVVGHFIAMFLDRYSTWKWGEKDENKKLKKNDKGQNIVELPIQYSYFLILFRIVVFGALIFVICKKYPEFSPF